MTAIPAVRFGTGIVVERRPVRVNEKRRAAVDVPGVEIAADVDAVPVVHVVEGTTPKPDRLPKDGRAHLYVAWRASGSKLTDWYLGGLDQAADSGLMASVLTACQAVHLLRTCPGLTAPRCLGPLPDQHIRDIGARCLPGWLGRVPTG